MRKKNFIFQDIHIFPELELLFDQNLHLISDSFFEPSMISFSFDAFHHLSNQEQDDLLHFAHFIDCRLNLLDGKKFCSLLSYAVYLKYFPYQILNFSDQALVPLILYSYMEPLSFYQNENYSKEILETIYHRGKDSIRISLYMEIANDLLEKGISMDDLYSYFSNASSEELVDALQEYGKTITKKIDESGVNL